MYRRSFIKTMGIVGAGIASGATTFLSCTGSDVSNAKLKKWVWIVPESGLSEGEWEIRLDKLKQKGIDAVLVQVYASHTAWYESDFLPVQEPLLETLIEVGKRTGMEVHAWIWTMPNNNPYYIENHPDYYVVNRLRKPAHTHPAYVGYYRFMCPNQPGVKDFLTRNIRFLANLGGLDGIHLDYIRMPDVIIAEALQPVYNVVQDKEYPEFDYCYCERCRQLFREKTGADPLKDLDDPAASKEWVQFRYDSVSSLVNGSLIPPIQQKGKQATAAVFPNWESVRQQWSKWNMDAFFPMLYHNFYNASLDWIGEQLISQIRALDKPAPVYSGLFVPALTAEELREAVDISIRSGAAGYALFSYRSMEEDHWKLL